MEMKEAISEFLFFCDVSKISDQIRYAVSFGKDNRKYAFFITHKNEVFAAGYNENGCLGVGDTNSRTEPTKVGALRGKKVIAIASGTNSFVSAITANGRLYTWGYNGKFNLGNGNTTTVYSPVIVNEMRNFKIIQIACGDQHTIALTNRHQVFGWGYNGYGQLGDGNGTQHPSPYHINQIPEDACIKSIGCSANSSYALSMDGELYAWGFNENGQLGLGNRQSQYTPVKVPDLMNIPINEFMCGRNYVLALTDDNCLLSWGDNCSGQLGTGDIRPRYSPALVDFSDIKIKEIGASILSSCSVARSVCGKIYAWGHCRGSTIMRPKPTHWQSLNEAFFCMSNAAIIFKPLEATEEEDDEYEDGSLSKCLKDHVDNEEISDIRFIVEDKPIYGHLSFLRMRSPYLKRMLDSNWSANQKEVKIMNQTYKAFRAYIQYLYTDKLVVDPVDAMDLLTLANEYLEQRLKEKCETFMFSNVTVENVFFLYEAAIKLSAKKLEDFTFDFALHHLDEAVLTDAYDQLDREISHSFLRKVAIAKKQKS